MPSRPPLVAELVRVPSTRTVAELGRVPLARKSSELCRVPLLLNRREVANSNRLSDFGRALRRLIGSRSDR